MYLLLGKTDDALARTVQQTLEKRGAQVRFLADPFSESTSFSWRLDSTHTSTALVFEDGTCATETDISGVFLRWKTIRRMNRANSDDYSYIQAEIEAAVLGWVWSLPCLVINRVPAWIWYWRKPPLRFWSRLLQESGLPVTIYEPKRRVRSTNEEASSRVGIRDQSLVSCRACVVGQVVVWQYARPAAFDRYESALIEFTRRTGLSLLELSIVRTRYGGRVNEVDPFPKLTRFRAASRERITEAIAKLFTDSDS
jgi:hypothetical protein